MDESNTQSSELINLKQCFLSVLSVAVFYDQVFVAFYIFTISLIHVLTKTRGTGAAPGKGDGSGCLGHKMSGEGTPREKTELSVTCQQYGSFLTGWKFSQMHDHMDILFDLCTITFLEIHSF